MDVITRFILIVSGIVVATAVGYLTRKRDWLDESCAGPLMFYIVILGWTPASALVLWQLPLQWSLIALPVVSTLLPVCLAPFGYFFSRIHRLDSKSAGTFIVASGISNIGFTMGAFVCYCLFGMLGLGYANLFAATWAVPYVGFYYPLARRYGDPHARLDIRFLLRTFFDIRALPVLGSVIGLAFNIIQLPFPGCIATFHLLDILIILSLLTSFAVIGLQIHFSHLARQKLLHASLATVKFVITPALTMFLMILAERIFGSLPVTARHVILIQSFMPTAIFTVVIANLFDLEPRLAGMLFLVNTVVFLAVVLPILTFFLR